MADVINNVVNLTMPTVARTAKRDELVDSTSPLYVRPVNIFAGRNQTRENNMAGYLLTFDPQVWALLLFFLALLSIVLAFLDVVLRKMRGLRATALESWNEHFWMLFENMFCEASARMPEATVLRIVSAVWWIAIVVLMNAFAGQMRACLMVKSERTRINTLIDIASKPHLKVYLLKNTVATRYLESSQGTAEKTVWRMIGRHRTDLYGLLRFSDEMMTEIVQEKAVMIHADTISLTEARKFCEGGPTGEFYLGTENLYTLMFGAYMNRGLNHILRQRIKRIVAALRESGIAEFKYLGAMLPMERCSIKEEEEQLKLQDLVSVFYLYAGIIAACMLVFVAETVIGRANHGVRYRRRVRQLKIRDSP
nr:uncharacterized protein LOC129382470 [Dermacentor andersoni]XP_054922453.1 uncharacterized protein LOC129382470 [Dermacentor andersoni]XP_054922454.1 uncharacterized protein LOC129382470 [Dermacentor andersoni]